MPDGNEGTAFLFDFDGTVTATELLPLVASRCGIAEEMAELTRATIAGEVPFDASFRRRVELLSAVPVATVVDIVMAVPVLEQLLEWILEHRDRCWVVTGNLDCWVQPWLDHHGLRGYTSQADIGPRGVAVGHILRKESVLAGFPGRTVAVGDGANDAELLRQATVGVANAIIHDVAPVVLEVADVLVMDEEVLCRTLSRL